MSNSTQPKRAKITGENVMAEDQGYRNSLTKVEPYGIEHIPHEERHGSPASQFFLWFAAGLNFPLVVLGFSAAYFGLSFMQALSAIIAATVVAASLMGLLSTMGVRLGVPQQMQGRGPLGFIGNLFPVAYVNVFAGIGWAAVTVILGGQAIAILTGMSFWASATILVAVQLFVAVMGYNLIHFLQKVLTPILFVGFVVISFFVGARGEVAGQENPAAEGFAGIGGWIIFFGYFLSYLIAWMPFSSDYSRYLPNTKRNRIQAGVYTALGNGIPVIWMGTLGVLLGSTAQTDDTILALNDLMGNWAVIGLLIVATSSLTQNFLNVYGGAISVQTMGIPVKRHFAVVFICIAALAIALWGQNGFNEGFTAFLNLTAYCIAPYITVVLLDFRFAHRASAVGVAELYDKRRRFEWGFVAWLVGFFGSSPFWISAVFTGPIAAANPQIGDLSFYVGAILAAVAYFLTRMLRPINPPDMSMNTGNIRVAELHEEA